MTTVYYYSETPQEPFRGSAQSAGWDLLCLAPEAIVIAPFSVRNIGTGIHLYMPEGVHCELKTRSSVARQGITTLGGIIDNDYHGEIIIVMANVTPVTYRALENARLAQMVFYGPGAENITMEQLTYADFHALELRARGDKGFGSSGQ